MENPLFDSRELINPFWQAEQAAYEAERYMPTLSDAPHLGLLPELQYLNAHWVIETDFQRYEPARRSVLGAVKRRIKRFIARIVFPALSGYLLQERAFLSNLVRLQNEIVRKTEQLSDANQLLAQAIRAESNRLTERTELLHKLLETRVAKLEGEQPPPG